MFDEDKEFYIPRLGVVMTEEEEIIQDEIDGVLEILEEKYNIWIDYRWKYKEVI